MAGVAYVLGAGHSGSSLLDVLLGSHPAVTSAGEVHRVTIGTKGRLCCCGSVVPECSYWREVLAALAATRRPLSWEDLRTSIGPNVRASISGWALQYVALVRPFSGVARSNEFVAAQWAAAESSWRLFQAMATVTEASWVIDSSKTSGRYLALAAAAEGPVRAIHLVRDGRAVAASHMRRDAVSMEVAAKRWKSDVRKARAALVATRRDLQLTVRYEDLCQDPNAVLEGIYRFLGVRPATWSGIPEFGSYHCLPGNSMLYRPIDGVRSDESWRRALDSSDLVKFERIAGGTNRRYGYGG